MADRMLLQRRKAGERTTLGLATFHISLCDRNTLSGA
jgi:hypothetical protein